ncbi:MAG: ABC transporter ATP-binding protein [Rhodospirillales bacterium]|nr:ABC transporter ATP-binding protein [Rhodospirillales bacterium]
MVLNKANKYKLDYTPDTNIPAGLRAYVWMVVRRNPVMWGVFVLMDIIHGVRYPLSYLLVGMVIDLITGLPVGAPIPHDVWLYTAAIFGVLIIGELAHAIPHYYAFDWWKRARAELRSDLFAYTLGHSYTYFQDHFAGSLARKVSEGIERGLNLQEIMRWQILLPIVSMGMSGLVLLGVSGIYSALVAVFLLTLLFPVVLKQKKLREKSQIYADSCSDVTGQIVDSLTNMASVKSYAHERLEIQEHARVSEEQMKAWHKMLRAFLLLDNYRRATLAVFGGGMMVACILGWQNGLISLGQIATIMGLSFNFTANAWNLSFGIIHMMEALGYLNDSLKTLIQPHSVSDAPGAPTLRVARGAIEFRHVHFEYENKAVFTDLNLEIAPGQRVGLVGHSGAGKSTLINLLQRFYDIRSGEILIDGQNIACVTQASLRQSIAVIPQDTSLFHRTIMDNIRYGRLKASDADVTAAAEKAHALRFIEELPDGFHTYVGERGVKLSGGQRQRIAIARAILKDAPILILDEATSALDSESEKEIQAALKNLMANKTVIAIAHRLSTIQHLDRLLVMEDGAITEDGTHAALVKAGGVYQKLWAMQSGGFLPK